MIFDSTYLLIVVVTVVLGVVAQAGIRQTYKKWSNVYAASGLTGAEAARRMLDSYGLHHIKIQQISGELTDNYDPRTQTLNLSQGVYGARSVAATGIACHEAGHAVQHAIGYYPIKIRMAVVPVVNIASNFWIILLMIGFILNNFNLIWIAIILYALVVAFQVITLPVEFNASRRAIDCVEATMALPDEQDAGARSVLRAAAMTYVAAALGSLLQLIYFIGLARRN